MTTEYINTLRESRDSYTIILDSFHKTFRPGKEKIYCFFEGHDQQFYSSIIGTHFKGNYESFTCGGKDTVLKLYDLLISYTDFCIFFVDRDFDNYSYCSCSHIFTTCGYSIENYYTTSDCVKQILSAELRMPPDQIENALSIYNQMHLDFEDKATLLNAWIHAVKQKNPPHISRKIKISKKNMNSFFTITSNSITKNYNLKSLNSISDLLPTPITQEEIENSIQSIKNNGHSLRGKFEAWFLSKFLQSITNDRSNEPWKSIQNRPSTSCDSIVTQFSQYATIPRRLIQFIKDSRYCSCIRITN